VTEADGAVRVELLRQFAGSGRAPTHGQVGEALGLAENEAAASFRRLADAHAIVLKPGTLELWMAAPFSAVETPYRVDTERGSFYANCAWDALGVLAMLGTDGGVTTTCDDCGQALELQVDGARVAGDGVVHFLVPAAHWWDDIGYT
jgi:hypothetical protein